MKMSISWHMECLNNQKKSNERRKEELKNLTNEIIRSENSIKFYEYQIQEAQKEKKIGFDDERYKIKMIRKE